MKDIDISVRTNINDDSRINIGIYFKTASDYGLVSINVRVICTNGDIYDLLSNRLIFISSDSSFWSDSILQNYRATPVKAIVEIHSSGKLLYIQSFTLENNREDDKIYILNTDVRWRREDSLVISVVPAILYPLRSF